jgi:hypothetical protein
MSRAGSCMRADQSAQFDQRQRKNQVSISDLPRFDLYSRFINVWVFALDGRQCAWLRVEQIACCVSWLSGVSVSIEWLH